MAVHSESEPYPDNLLQIRGIPWENTSLYSMTMFIYLLPASCVCRGDTDRTYERILSLFKAGS